MVKTIVIAHAHLANIVSSYHNLVAVRYSCTRGALGRPLVGIYQDLLCSFLNNVCVFSVGLLEHEVSSPNCIPLKNSQVTQLTCNGMCFKLSNGVSQLTCKLTS